MRELLAEGIGARLADIGLHAGQIRQVEIEPRKFLPTQILGHQHGDEFLVLRKIAQHLFFLMRRQLDDLADRIQGRFDSVGGLLGDENDAIVPAVGCKLDAKAVDDAASGRWDQPLTDAVVLGLGHVLVAVDDLQLIQPSSEQREDSGHAAAQQQRAPRETRVAALVLAVEQRHQKSLRKGPTRWR